MFLHNIKDFGLSVGELEDKYEKLGAHPCYTRAEWKAEKGIAGYWFWVWHKLGEEEDNLANDSPFQLDQ